MQYRGFGKLDWQVSALGFGAMRLPVIDGDSGRIDEDPATQVLHYAIDQGVNYVDTAYNYHKATSEAFLGRALAGGYRQRVRLTTKLPPWLVEKAADFDRILDEQLGKLQTPRVDFYLLHSLDIDVWRRLRDLGVLAWAERAQADGRIGRLGFSFHDTYDAFQEIVDAYDNWALCQIYYNYLYEDLQAGTRGLRYAAGRGLAVSVMGPLWGGLLAGTPPPAVSSIWAAAPVQHTPAEWGLRWVWDHPEVSLALSGMNTVEQVRENVAIADRAGVGAMSAGEHAVVAKARDRYQELRPIACTGCKYCQPCPNDVNIPEIFDNYNLAMMHNAADRARLYYSWLPEKMRADKCLQCGDCESMCPQKIAIMEWLPKVHEFLAAA